MYFHSTDGKMEAQRLFHLLSSLSEDWMSFQKIRFNQTQVTGLNTGVTIGNDLFGVIQEVNLDNMVISDLKIYTSS